MINLLLLITAIILFLTFGTIGFIYSILWRMLIAASAYFWQVALAIDELGNTVCQDLFNNTMRAEGGHRFGNSNETVNALHESQRKADANYGTSAWIEYVEQDA